MNRYDRELIASQLKVLAENVRRLPDDPMNIQIDSIIQALFEDVMCQLRDFKRGR